MHAAEIEENDVRQEGCQQLCVFEIFIREIL